MVVESQKIDDEYVLMFWEKNFKPTVFKRDVDK